MPLASLPALYTPVPTSVASLAAHCESTRSGHHLCTRRSNTYASVSLDVTSTSGHMFAPAPLRRILLFQLGPAVLKRMSRFSRAGGVSAGSERLLTPRAVCLSTRTTASTALASSALRRSLGPHSALSSNSSSRLLFLQECLLNCVKRDSA